MNPDLTENLLTTHSMTVDHRNQLIVTAQRGNDQENKNLMPVLKIWNYNTLETLFSIQDFDSANASVLSTVFSKSVTRIYFYKFKNDYGDNRSI